MVAAELELIQRFVPPTLLHIHGRYPPNSSMQFLTETRGIDPSRVGELSRVLDSASMRCTMRSPGCSRQPFSHPQVHRPRRVCVIPTHDANVVRIIVHHTNVSIHAHVPLSVQEMQRLLPPNWLHIHASENGNASQQPVTEDAWQSIVDAAVPFCKNASSTSCQEDDDGSDNFCCICHEIFKEKELIACLPCNHNFHLRPCSENWLKRNGTCPLCRLKV